MNEYQMLALRSIRPHPENPRFDLGDVSDLTADIKAAGLIEPLVVVPGSHGKRTGTCRDCDQQVPRTPTGVLAEHLDGPMSCPGGSEPAGDEWYLVAGHRRHHSCLAAGLWEAPARVMWDVTTAADALVVMLRENTHRRDLTPLEEAHGYQRLTLFGLTPTKIAQQTRQPKKAVDRRLALTKLPDTVRGQLKVGQITLADAEALAGLSPERAERLLTSVGTKELRQEIVREQTGGDDSTVAARLRSDFLAPFLSGAQRPPAAAKDRVLRQVVMSVLASSRRSTVRAWVEAVGLREASELGRIAPMRALIGLAAVSGSTTDLYGLLGELGHELSPVEIDMLESGAA